MTINLSLILKKTRIQKQFPLSGLVFLDSLAASALQEAGGYAISRQNNLAFHLGCNTCWLGYFTLVCLWCGRTVGRTVSWLPNFLGWVDYHIFLPMVLRCARFARESSATMKTVMHDTTLNLICIQSRLHEVLFTFNRVFNPCLMNKGRWYAKEIMKKLSLLLEFEAFWSFFFSDDKRRNMLGNVC